MKKFWRQGEPFVWATGLSLTLVLLMTGLLLYVVLCNGIGVFWPKSVAMAPLNKGGMVMGEIFKHENGPDGLPRMQFKIGNRDLNGLDFAWIAGQDMGEIEYPAQSMVIERQEYGNFYGFLKTLALPDMPSLQEGEPEDIFFEALLGFKEKKADLNQRAEEIMASNRTMEAIEAKLAKLTYRGAAESAPEVLKLKEQKKLALIDFEKMVTAAEDLRIRYQQNQAVFSDANGRLKEIPFLEIIRAYQPNTMSTVAKLSYYGKRLWELFFDEPRESNTEGGLFPAIFGTIILVFLMSALSFPMGVVAGVYLREYAKEGLLVKTVRIAVNNLAGIPSIVYGIFGLGFFVYGIGSSIDQLFFADTLPTPTFGTGGILWASLTLGLLTVPVVIVATEEALGSIPPGVREGSLALAATKYQTLCNLLLPMASPGIMTGFILAMARAAGEVAPLMITGVVKLAPALPLDSEFPFVHLNRKFMHLGFHIYDIGFQSPNVEAAKPMVYVTTLLLIVIVLVMTSIAIHLRNKMRTKYAISDV